MNVDELMAEMTWVRRLARGLVGQEAGDDIAQDAYLVASERAPGDGRPLRPWLHRVVTNLVRMRHRSAVRRDAREKRTETDSVPTPDELLERVATHRALADAVLELREPYRSTIVLHYVEGLTSADIARRLGISSATVRQRLKHALDRLRESLAQRTDPPTKGWLAALIPLAHVNPPLAAGALVMKKWIVAIVVLVLLLVVGGVVRRHLDRSSATGSSSQSVTSSRETTTTRGWLATNVRGKTVELPSWMALANGHARHLAGRVMFAGAPVANATVRIGVSVSSPRVRMPEMTPGPAFMQAGVRQTDAKGRFDFGMMPPVNLVISAESDGRAPTSLSIRVSDPTAKPAPENVEIVLGECRSRIAGTVRDGASPISHARLLVAGLAGSESDANGAFSVCMPDADYPNLRVEADGYGSINVQVPPMQGVMRRDIVLVPEATISGVVVDDTGKAIPGAVVAARPAADGQDEASSRDTIADQDGRFELDEMAPSKYGVVAFTATGSSPAAVVVAAAGVATRDLSLVVKERAVVRGHVVMNGKPVAGAWVGNEKSPYMPHSSHYAESQADGSFVLDLVPLGHVELNAYPYDVVSPTSIDVKSLAGTEVTLEVKPRGGVVGKITRLGVAASNARIRVDPINLTAIANADGTYELRGLPAGTYEMSFQNGRAFANRSLTVTDPVLQTIDVELDGGGELLGSVVDEAGRGISNVLVVFDSTAHDDSCNTFTDDDGAFDCASLAGHTDYTPRVFSGAGAKEPFPLVSGVFAPVHVEDGTSVVRGVQVAIKHEMLSIRGRVVDDSGAIVADAHVTVPDTNWGDAGRTHADEGGGFVIENLIAGAHYNLRAHLSDGSSGDARDVPAGATGVEIKLIRPGTISGTLVGLPSSVMVIASQALSGNDDLYEGKVDGDRFAITGLPPGRYTVQAAVDRHQVDGAVVDVKSGATSAVALRSKARATISGRVTDLATGAPIAKMACRATLSLGGREGPLVGGMVADQFTDATGAFSLDAPTGRVRVACNYQGPAYSMAGGDFDIASSSTTVALTAVAIPASPADAGLLLEPFVIPPTVTKSIAPGVVVGDQILAIDGLDTSNMLGHEALALLFGKSPGTTVAVSLMHDGKRVTVRVSLVAGT
ncbi:MAG TPA: sigma-70 family RNA polymerase sigma factor [Kofleriaceae bacterium]|jgi:RNA polymerase sigma-70 factor (ECF subfamily)